MRLLSGYWEADFEMVLVQNRSEQQSCKMMDGLWDHL